MFWRTLFCVISVTNGERELSWSKQTKSQREAFQTAQKKNTVSPLSCSYFEWEASFALKLGYHCCGYMSCCSNLVSGEFRVCRLWLMVPLWPVLRDNGDILEEFLSASARHFSQQWNPFWFLSTVQAAFNSWFKWLLNDWFPWFYYLVEDHNRTI